MIGLKRIFGGISTQYMVRAYIIGAVIYALMIFISLQGEKDMATQSVVLAYFGLCTLLFPFAKLVWDQLKGLVLGETFLILPIIFLYSAKLIVNLVLFSFAVFIAPFGIVFIWFKTKEA